MASIRGLARVSGVRVVHVIQVVIIRPEDDVWIANSALLDVEARSCDFRVRLFSELSASAKRESCVFSLFRRCVRKLKFSLIELMENGWQRHYGFPFPSWIISFTQKHVAAFASLAALVPTHALVLDFQYGRNADLEGGTSLRPQQHGH